MKTVNHRLFRFLDKTKNSEAGFTLAEAMIASVIGMIIVGMVMILYIGVQNSMTAGLALAEINSDAGLAMDRIVRDVRWATQLETSRTIGGTTYITGDNRIVIKVPSIDASGDIITSTYDYIVYALDSSNTTRLRRLVDPNASSSRSSLNQIVAENISSFSLSSAGTGLSSVGSLSGVRAVEVAITANKQPLQGKTITESLTSEVEIRND